LTCNKVGIIFKKINFKIFRKISKNVYLIVYIDINTSYKNLEIIESFLATVSSISDNNSADNFTCIKTDLPPRLIFLISVSLYSKIIFL